MWRTRVGYAGGTSENPTYRSMGDHTECFQVDFDPGVVSYDDLLQLAWQSHDPTRQAFKTQYASLILAHDEAQLAAARASAMRLEAAPRRKVVTRIEPLVRFWPAEEYHQHYYWKRFAEEWARRAAGDTPDVRSDEFARWLASHGVVCPGPVRV